MRLWFGKWTAIAKESAGRAAIFAKFLCLLHVTNTYIFSPILVMHRFLNLMLCVSVYVVMVVEFSFQVYGPSMLPTLNLAGDVVLSEYISHRLGKVGPGDVVLIQSPENPRKIITKRIVAMEGEVVSFLVDPSRSDRSRTVVVPKGHVWIQGDNIYASNDSRNFGPIPYGLIQGKVCCRILSMIVDKEKHNLFRIDIGTVLAIAVPSTMS
ncbi:Mitochondrial inner membrane protease subunit 1 [Cynara cardunculus var. scolymus]|uniref:Mitochondrial inner membrane protease subunit 1 n=1 Tax=Cynara cardunculus var. scolymus TaxID=59895 RepID=A0A103XMC0_CYNCS|nr:Mitochondrial inner membrane protease subunit 1 [Cynara cardunculus var. scolymus]